MRANHGCYHHCYRDHIVHPAYGSFDTSCGIILLSLGSSISTLDLTMNNGQSGKRASLGAACSENLRRHWRHEIATCSRKDESTVKVLTRFNSNYSPANSLPSISLRAVRIQPMTEERTSTSTWKQDYRFARFTEHAVKPDEGAGPNITNLMAVCANTKLFSGF